MSAERAIYIDSSAIVKLAVAEPESASLRRYLRRRGPLVVSALARTEVGRALMPFGASAVRRGSDVLARLDLIRVSDRVLSDAATITPAELRSLDAIHLATIGQLGSSVARVLTYDDRMASAVRAMGLAVVAPS
jgi:predicted nucleic acid-binding protein